MAAPEDDVKTWLDAGSLSTNVYKGPVRPAEPPAMPHKAIFCMQSGGYKPEPYMDGTQTSYRFSRVQIRTRSEPNAYQAARDLADSVFSRMHQAAISGYVRVTVESSQPLAMGRDAFGCYEYSVNVILEKRYA